MAMVREPNGYHTRVRILSGYGPATPHSSFEVVLPDADTLRSVWAVADVDGSSNVRANSPLMVTSPHTILARAVIGTDRVVIESGAIEVLYVRPHLGAWRYAVADGGGRDLDGVANGTIVMPLLELKPFKGNPHAPERIEEGDFLLLIDPRGTRTATIEVHP
jgi:hypothetical protein